MASKQRHDLGRRKRLLSEPVRKAAAHRRFLRKSEAKEMSDWYKVWLRTNRLPDPRSLEYRNWERMTAY